MCVTSWCCHGDLFENPWPCYETQFTSNECDRSYECELVLVHTIPDRFWITTCNGLETHFQPRLVESHWNLLQTGWYGLGECEHCNNPLFWQVIAIAPGERIFSTGTQIMVLHWFTPYNHHFHWKSESHQVLARYYIINLYMIKFTNKTRKSSCVNARGIPPAV